MAEAVKSPAEEGRVVLRNVGWETYERLAEEDPDRSTPRLFYDRGMLEIVSPSFGHEQFARVIASLVEHASVELDIDMISAGSTTFKSEKFERGFEPDACFYFPGKFPQIRGKRRIDLDAGDPPPDLVVEVHITSPSLRKLPIYARLGASEVWRHDGERLAILRLHRPDAEEEAHYVEVSDSVVLAPARVSSDSLTRSIDEGLTSERPAWTRKVREWARESSKNS